MKPIKCNVHIEWEDGCTIEVRPFPSIRKALKYIKHNGIKKYEITTH